MNINLSSEIHNIETVKFDSKLDQLTFLMAYATKIVEQAEREVTRQLLSVSTGDCKTNPELFHRAVMQKIRSNRANHDEAVAWLELVRCYMTEQAQVTKDEGN